MRLSQGTPFGCPAALQILPGTVGSIELTQTPSWTAHTLGKRSQDAAAVRGNAVFQSSATLLE
jgi:hypothetical protein